MESISTPEKLKVGFSEPTNLNVMVLFSSYIKQVKSGQIEPKFAFIKDGIKSSKVKKLKLQKIQPLRKI